MSGSNDRAGLVAVGGPISGRRIADSGYFVTFCQSLPKWALSRKRPKCKEREEIAEIMRANRTFRYCKVSVTYYVGDQQSESSVYAFERLGSREVEQIIKSMIESGKKI